MENQTFTLVGRNIWMYWPGEDAKLFEENFEKGQITCQPKTGSFGDLSPLLEAPEGFNSAFTKTYDPTGSMSRSHDMLIDLCIGMKIGDIILARSSVKAIVGVGIVTGEYIYDKSRTSFNHCRSVQWLCRGCWSFEGFQESGWNRLNLIIGTNRQVAEKLVVRICGDELQKADSDFPSDKTIPTIFSQQNYNRPCDTPLKAKAPNHPKEFMGSMAKSLNRGVKPALIHSFKGSPLYQLYRDHPEELIICMRRNYLNLYYRRNNIAEVSQSSSGELKVGIHPYFLEMNGDKTITLTGDEIVTKIIDKYERIKHLAQTKKKSTPEMVAQQILYAQNNANPESKWYCVDLEWARTFSCEQEKQRSGLSSQMDIIAISKDKPFRVAIIELKYGSKALSGNSGVIKHIEDFRKFLKGYDYNGQHYDNYQILIQDVCNILRDYMELGVPVPESLQKVTPQDFAKAPEFFIMTLDNKLKQGTTVLPKQTMGSYLFSPNTKHYLEWDCKRPANEAVMEKLGFDVLDLRSPLRVTFIFSKMDISNLTITDILEDPSYEITRPHI